MQGRDMKMLFLCLSLLLKPVAATADEIKQLPHYTSHHASCMEEQMRMWGEVAEFMEDLAKAYCYCTYTYLEEKGIYDSAGQELASSTCYRQGTRDKKDAFIRRLLPLHEKKLQHIKTKP